MLVFFCQKFCYYGFMLLTILCLFLLFALLLVFMTFSELVAFLRTRVPFVPTNSGDIEYIVKKLGISSADTFYDLGSGNGRVVFLVSKLSGATAVGFELGWWTYLFAKIKHGPCSLSPPMGEMPECIRGQRGCSLRTKISLNKTGPGQIMFMVIYTRR